MGEVYGSKGGKQHAKVCGWTGVSDLKERFREPDHSQSEEVPTASKQPVCSSIVIYPDEAFFSNT